MGLCITRGVGTGWYGGVNLDTQIPETTFDHKVFVKRIRDSKRRQEVFLNIEDKDGETAQVLEVDETLVLGTCVVRFLEVQSFYENGQRLIQARFLMEAPKDYAIIRNNARKRQ